MILVGGLICLIIPVVFISDAFLTYKPKPLAVVLDFGENNFINASFNERFINALTNASSFHPKALDFAADLLQLPLRRHTRGHRLHLEVL